MIVKDNSNIGHFTALKDDTALYKPVKEMSVSEGEAKDFPQIDRYRTGMRINAMMHCCHLRPSDLQDYLGLSCVQTVYRWLEGINLPSTDNLYALSCLFSVRTDDLLVGNRSPGQSQVSAMQELRLAFYYDHLHYGRLHA